MCQWHCHLDAGQSSAVKYWQDWHALVRDFSSTSSVAHFSSQDRIWPHQAVGLSHRSRNLLWHRPQHAMPHPENMLPTASPFYANCAVSDGQFQHQYTTCSSSLSSCHGSTTAMLCWWAYQPTCTTVCSQCSTLLRDPSPAYDDLTTSPTHSPVSTGWRSLSVFSSSWRQSSIVHWTVRLLTTWLQICAVCLICRLDDAWDPSLTDQLDVRQSQCSTVGDRAFAVAAARLWNSLPHDIVASDTLSQFRCGLKTFLSRQSYPSILFQFFTLWSLQFLLRPR